MPKIDFSDDEHAALTALVREHSFFHRGSLWGTEDLPPRPGVYAFVAENDARRSEYSPGSDGLWVPSITDQLLARRGEVFYIGCHNNIRTRVNQHRRDSRFGL
jgi:hypothetical protein